jgi:DNA-directed RNA polymerase specialized sigma24 family protein
MPPPSGGLRGFRVGRYNGADSHPQPRQGVRLVNGERSVTGWIERLKAGDREAVAPVWERYFGRLVHLARQRLRGAPRLADEEDVALSALDSVCRGLEQGRFAQLLDRDGLWRLLVVLTERKGVDRLRAQRRQKRGGGKLLGESALGGPDDGAAGIAQFRGPEPDPALAALMAEECQRLLRLLDDDGLRKLALLKMEGHANEEIAAKLGCALRTVERKLGVIRGLWERELAP